MKKTLVVILKSIFIGFLMINIGIYGCMTLSLWKKDPVEKEVLYEKISSKISVMVIDNETIAVLPVKDDNQKFNNLATIYKFDTSKYDSIKDKIRKVEIKENINISSKEKKIEKSEATFKIILSDSKPIYLRYFDTTLTKRSENEINFDDNRIVFNRKISGDLIPEADLSWLWKTPLTPITVVVDVATTAVVVVVALPVLLIWGLSNSGHGH